MDLWPAPASESERRHPREGGGPCLEELDSRLRGNDVCGTIFRRGAETGDQGGRRVATCPGHEEKEDLPFSARTGFSST